MDARYNAVECYGLLCNLLVLKCSVQLQVVFLTTKCLTVDINPCDLSVANSHACTKRSYSYKYVARIYVPFSVSTDIKLAGQGPVV